jgi:hypothetical protein
MATIRLRGKKYRAEVTRMGVRRSASFTRYEQAEVWAQQQEIEILGYQAPWKSSAPPPPVHKIIAERVVAAGLHRTVDEILAQPRFYPTCGVYFLIFADEVVYVGKSVELHSRVTMHHARWKQFDSYTYIPCAPESLDALERHYIRELQPRLNVAGVRFDG